MWPVDKKKEKGGKNATRGFCLVVFIFIFIFLFVSLASFDFAVLLHVPVLFGVDAIQIKKNGL